MRNILESTVINDVDVQVIISIGLVWNSIMMDFLDFKTINPIMISLVLILHGVLKVNAKVQYH